MRFRNTYGKVKVMSEIDGLDETMLEFDVEEFLHPEHEIRYFRNLETDRSIQEYMARLVSASTSEEEARLGFKILRRSKAIWEEARDWFLSTLDTKL